MALLVSQDLDKCLVYNRRPVREFSTRNKVGLSISCSNYIQAPHIKGCPLIYVLLFSCRQGTFVTWGEEDLGAMSH